MAEFIVLDSKPLSDAAGPPGRTAPDECRRWISARKTAGDIIVMPGIIDYEVRRKLLHLGATAGIRRLDGLRTRLDFRETGTAILDRAAALWAHVRRAGLPTAGWESLDADCILAAHALAVGGPGDRVTVATSNPGHLARFPGIVAGDWSIIIP